MNSLNSILLEGNLVADPEISSTSNTSKKVQICTFNIATNRFYKKNDEYEKEVSYFEIHTYGKLAEVCGEYLKKGRGVRVIGSLKQNRWTDQYNKQRSRIFIMADHVEFKPVFKGKGEENV